MKKTLSTEAQIVRMLREEDGATVSVLAKKHGVNDQTLHNWRKHIGGLEPPDAPSMPFISIQIFRNE